MKYLLILILLSSFCFGSLTTNIKLHRDDYSVSNLWHFPSLSYYTSLSYHHKDFRYGPPQDHRCGYTFYPLKTYWGGSVASNIQYNQYRGMNFYYPYHYANFHSYSDKAVTPEPGSLVIMGGLMILFLRKKV